MKRLFTHLTETRSTNQWMQEELPRGTYEEGWVVYTDYQTAGRGQRGNHWESEPGKNLLLTLLLQPRNLPARGQFILSEAVALGCLDYLSGQADGFSIKWPNDLYWQEKKIAGILIENDLSGPNIGNCYVGIGLNINQTDFRSDAPNPVSLRQITGRETDLKEALDGLYNAILHRYSQIDQRQQLHHDYLSHLFRYGIPAPFHNETEGTFTAVIDDVEPSGYLVLRHTDGSRQRYFFKEGRHVIGSAVL